jgi:predicted MPP superfamily phosphohydrolase
MDLQLAERPPHYAAPPINETILETLDSRLGPLHARQRLGIENDHEARASREGLKLFPFENRRLSPAVIRRALKLTGLYWRARKNAENIQIRQHDIRVRQLPTAFDGFAILQLSDLHVDISAGAMRRLIELLPTVAYDLCVLTGDYRGKTFGPFEPAIEGLARIRAHLSGPVYGILGNHDTIRMVPALEAMGIRMLINETEILERSGERIHLAGIDDAHFYRLDNIEKTALQIPAAEFAILLSHTPEVYRQAAHAGFSMLLSGHTHGGQICLPGAIPITLDSVLPRRLGSGAWRYNEMFGYTSVGVGSSLLPARLNCLPEITLHCLRCEPTPLRYGRSLQLSETDDRQQQKLVGNDCR